jgi:hypothetical protein
LFFLKAINIFLIEIVFGILHKIDMVRIGSMQIVHSNYPPSINAIDSTGSIYCQSSENQLVDTKILNFGFINYAGEGKDSLVQSSKATGEDFNYKKLYLSFEYSDLVFIILLFLLSLVAYVKFAGKNFLNRLLISIQNYSYSVSFFREKNLAYVFYHNILLFIFYICTGLFASIVLQYYGYSIPHTDKFVQMIILIGVCSIFLLTSLFVIWLSALIFGFSKISSEYLFYYQNLLKVLGIALLLFCLILFFLVRKQQTTLIYFSFFIVAIVYLVKTFRIFVIFFKNKLSLYYLILYFCALEIIPIILLVKIFNLLIYKGIINQD